MHTSRTRFVRALARAAPLLLLAACLPFSYSTRTSTQVDAGQAQESRAERLGRDACAAAPDAEKDWSGVTVINELVALREPEQVRSIVDYQRRSASAGIFYEVNAALDVAMQSYPNADRDATLHAVLVGCKDALASKKEASQ